MKIHEDIENTLPKQDYWEYDLGPWGKVRMIRWPVTASGHYEPDIIQNQPLVTAEHYTPVIIDWGQTPENIQRFTIQTRDNGTT